MKTKMDSPEPPHDIEYDSTKNIGIILDSIGPELYRDMYVSFTCLQCKKILGINEEIGTSGGPVFTNICWSIFPCPCCKATYCCSKHMKPIIDYNVSPIDSIPLSKDLINEVCLEYLYFLLSPDIRCMCEESEGGFPSINYMIEEAVNAFIKKNGKRYSVKKEILMQIPKTYLRCNACKTISSDTDGTNDNK